VNAISLKYHQSSLTYVEILKTVIPQYLTSRYLLSSLSRQRLTMSSSPDQIQAVALLEDIRKTLSSQHQLDPATRASVVAKLSNIRDVVETPVESVLRIFAQVILDSIRNRPVKVWLTVHILACTKCSVESSRRAWTIVQVGCQRRVCSESQRAGSKLGRSSRTCHLQNGERRGLQHPGCAGDCNRRPAVDRLVRVKAY